ncbi:hypothetical protein ABVV53_16650 [Novosphingobium sp. RD2P27]|uniref:PRC-barrel domain protein n=1 Tax=Novosphingobium kalidii TaxID=3230299 RepID=A0ABV2D5C7_9SPHN
MTRIMLLAAAGVALAAAAPVVAQDADDASADDAAVEAAMSHHDVMTVRNVTRREMVTGQRVFDASGKLVGIIARLSGNDVILADGKREFSVPITEFFAYNQYGKDYFATRQPKAVLQAQASTIRAKPLAAAN